MPSLGFWYPIGGRDLPLLLNGLAQAEVEPWATDQSKVFVGVLEMKSVQVPFFSDAQSELKRRKIPCLGSACGL